MQGVFNPMDYISYDVSPAITDSELLNLSDQDKMNKLIDQTKYHLRDNHGSLFIKALTDPKAREQAKLIIADYIKEYSTYTFDASMDTIIRNVQQDITELGIIQPLLDDPKVTNIDINGPDKIYIEQDGQEKYVEDIAFRSEEHFYQTIDKMLLPMGKTLTASEPHIDSQYEGFRVCAGLGVDRGGIGTFGPFVSIRKFAPDVFTDQEVISYGNISHEIRDFLADVVPGGANIVIVGGTNSGKTTSLMRLPLYLPEDTRIITIEDSPEMMLHKKEAYKRYKNILPLQKKYHEKANRAYDIAKLVGVSLRLRPTYIIIGEVRYSDDATQALHGMNTGHVVQMTVHANSAREGATRLVQMAGNNDTVAAQVASSVDLIAFQKKLKNGKRVVVEIAELVDYEGAKKPILKHIFKYDTKEQKHKKIGTISPALADKLRTNFIPEENIQRWTEV